MKKLLLSLHALLLGAGLAFAGGSGKDYKDKVIPPKELFRAGECQLGLYGAYGVGDVDKLHHSSVDRVHHAGGGGVELSHFFTNNFGISLEGTWLAGENTVVHGVAGNLIYRYPIEHGSWAVAPYAFIGGGGQFDGENVGTGHAGGGAEFRVSDRWGVFADGRWVIHDSTQNYALIRSGVRFVF